MTDEELISITDAAMRAGCHPQKIHRAIRSLELKATKVGWNWIIKYADFQAFMRNKKGE